MKCGPSGLAWKISSCSSPPPSRKTKRNWKRNRKPETSSEKHTPDLPKRIEELFRVAHRVSADGVLRADLRVRLLHGHPGHDPLQHAGADDGPAADHERQRADHSPAAGLRIDHRSVP